MTGEAGEVANELKKIIRDNEGKVSDLQREKLLLELGDVLWYVSAAAHELNSSLDDVAQLNIDKIETRKAAGVRVG